MFLFPFPTHGVSEVLPLKGGQALYHSSQLKLQLPGSKETSSPTLTVQNSGYGHTVTGILKKQW